MRMAGITPDKRVHHFGDEGLHHFGTAVPLGRCTAATKR
jgi:hypothetical protein